MRLYKHYQTFATLILGQHDGKNLSKNSQKLLSACKFLPAPYDILLCGPSLPQVQSPISKIHHLNATLQEQIADAIKTLIQKHNYTYVVGVANNFGKDIIPRVAGFFSAQPITDIVQIIDNTTFVRPIYAGNALAKVKTTEAIKFLTFRTSSFQAYESIADNPQILVCEVPPCRSELVGLEAGDSSRPELTTARIVVSGGRGVKSKENFKLINDLAEAFGDAAVGASRAAVDAGYCANDMQVGQTGKVVAPELYLAVGISGAVQHLAGMKDSKIIVAINNRPDQPIFEIATYGLEADLFTAVPELIQKLKKLKAD